MRVAAAAGLSLWLVAGAMVGPGWAIDSAVPGVLSDADAALYRKVFELQETGQWKAADAAIKDIDDKVLLGHVLAQRYLHPRKYRSQYKELKAWLADYADHPEARRIHTLALHRKPGNWRAPESPERLKLSASEGVATARRIPGKRLSKSNRSVVSQYKQTIRRALRRGNTLVAKRTITSAKVGKLFSDAEYDEARARLGQAYFSAGRDEWALKWAAAAERSGHLLPQAHWTAGLASWRLGRKEQAATHFEAAADNSVGDDWFHAGAAFWAARANLVVRKPARVGRWLEEAAAHPRAFYGILARRILDQPMPFKWDLPTVAGGTFEALEARPRGRRAMALVQVGQQWRAERELRELARGADETLANGVLALAARGNMAGLAVRLDHQLYPNGGGYDGAAYPIPAWAPVDGFSVDRALIYALIRQESMFNPKAKSWAGARGLMQLMPGTARFVARNKGVRMNKRSELFEPEFNLGLGQRYIEMLLANKKINGDLFLMAAAWNGGPGNLRKWRRKTEFMDDPLFFIESLPSRETRHFIERVLSNLWIYRDQLGQPSPSLDAIAAGDWPVYTALGESTEEVAENIGARKYGSRN